jgi:hypothetical protein
VFKGGTALSHLNELHTLLSLKVNSIGLDYKQSNKTDQYGNVFRFCAKVNSDGPDADVGRKAYDVFFVTLNPIAYQQKLAAAPDATTGR